MAIVTTTPILKITRIVPQVPATDLVRARKFYEGTLGFEFLREDPSPGIAFESGSGRVYLYKGEPSRGGRPALNLVVEDIEKTMEVLGGRGVFFQPIDMFGLKSVDGLFTMGDYMMAAFKDSEGNVISISNR